MSEYIYIGHGVYGFAEAQRLTGIPSSTIRRWTRGYTFRHGKKEYYSPPVLGVADDSGAVALRFADLLEVQVLDLFRKAGVSWPVMRRAVAKAIEITGHSHPFSREDFFTDGRAILMRVGEESLLNVISEQQEFERILRPFLHEDIDYRPENREPARWWPMGRNSTVVIDATRSFGAPICAPSGVRTHLLNQALSTEQDSTRVAWWYEVTEQEVADAVAFEQSLAA